MTFTGVETEIPLGAEGLNGSKNQSLIPFAELISADGVSLTTGALGKEGGTTKYNSTVITGAPSVLAGWDWFPSSGTQRMVIVCSDGKIYKDAGAGTFGTTLVSGLTVSDVIPSFAEGGAETSTANRKLFIYTEKNAIQVLSADGATTSGIASGNADWTGGTHPIFGLIHEDRHWAFMRHRAYYSLTTNHEDFVSAGASQLGVFPGEGDKIVGAISFRGALVVFKYPKGIYVIDTSDSDVTKWRVTNHTRQVGTLNSHTVAQIDRDVMFLDVGGNVHLLSATDEFGDVNSSNLSEASQMGTYIRDKFNLSSMGLAQGVYYPTKREVHFAVPAIGSSVNSARMVVDLNRPDRPRFRVSYRDTPVSMWIRRDSDNIPRPVYGDNAGFVRQLDDAAFSHDGAGYVCEFQTAHTDFSHVDPKLATVQKNGKFLELVMEPVGNWNLSVDVLWDGAIKQTIQFNLGTTGAAIGSFELGTDKLAGDSVLNRRKRLLGGGRRLSLIGRNSGSGESFSLAKFIVHFTPGDERVQTE